MNSMPTTPAGESQPAPATYTPGYVGAKLLMIAFGLGLFCIGLTHLWTPLRLVMLGERAVAEATTVTKAKRGMPDVVLTDDVQIQANLETRDRTYVFWNEFRFHAADGRDVNVRATVGSQLKPLYTLINSDGLPTTDVVYYDPANPETVVFPLIISTWFAAGSLAIGGLLIVMIGSVLLYWARKPIEVPHLPPAPAPRA